MTHALPMILPQTTSDRRKAKPNGQKAPLQTKEVWANLRAVQLLLGHAKIESP